MHGQHQKFIPHVKFVALVLSLDSNVCCLSFSHFEPIFFRVQNLM